MVPAKTGKVPAFNRQALLTKARLRIDEAAFLLECHPDTIRNYLRNRKLEEKRTPGGQRRVVTESVRKYL